MAEAKRVLPETMASPETGERLTRGVRPFEVAYKGAFVTVDLPGYYPLGEGEGVHVGDDMRVVDEALRALKRQVDGVPTPAEIRTLRKKLKLSQAAAGELFKVGANAFDKYERGLVAPSGPTVQLMTILERHPELVGELSRQAQ
jgi:HTH-type transcriptional regulator/antitoxin MqsA